MRSRVNGRAVQHVDRSAFKRRAPLGQLLLATQFTGDHYKVPVLYIHGRPLHCHRLIYSWSTTTMSQSYPHHLWDSVRGFDILRIVNSVLLNWIWKTSLEVWTELLKGGERCCWLSEVEIRKICIYSGSPRDYLNSRKIRNGHNVSNTTHNVWIRLRICGDHRINAVKNDETRCGLWHVGSLIWRHITAFAEMWKCFGARRMSASAVILTTCPGRTTRPVRTTNIWTERVLQTLFLPSDKPQMLHIC